MDVKDFSNEQAKAIFLLARAVDHLGFDTMGPPRSGPGAIEALGISISGARHGIGNTCLSDAIEGAGGAIAEAIRDAGNSIAEAIERAAEKT